MIFVNNFSASFKRTSKHTLINRPRILKSLAILLVPVIQVVVTNNFMTLSEFQEEIVKLFLRLNGYITSSLIIHSDKRGKNKTQIDLIAVRFPLHSQQDRIITSTEYLQIPTGRIDIIIGEVKAGNEKNQFNAALRGDRDAVEKLIKWIGIIDDENLDKVVDWLVAELKPKEVNELSDFPECVIGGLYSVRPMIFNLDGSKPRDNQKRFVYGQLMLDYIWECFRPDNERMTCSTTYPLNLWGPALLPIVEYFKDRNKTNPETVFELYDFFNLK